MSLAPVTLSDYLLAPTNSATSQHCFCTITSLTIFLDLLTGVEYLHNKNLVHRDLKPANIFLHPATTPALDTCCEKSCLHIPRIGDFGLAAVVDQHSTGPRVGTSFYSAPEKGVHEKIDVYALGVVAMEIFYKFGTGTERVFVLTKITGNGEFPKDTDEKLSVLVKGCVEKEQEKRWALGEVRKYCEEWKKELLGTHV